MEVLYGLFFKNIVFWVKAPPPVFFLFSLWKTLFQPSSICSPTTTTTSHVSTIASMHAQLLRKPAPYSSQMLPAFSGLRKKRKEIYIYVHQRGLQICPSSVEFTSVKNWTSKRNESVNNECNEVNSIEERERPLKKKQVEHKFAQTNKEQKGL